MSATKPIIGSGTDWAFSLFRPILQDLHLQDLNQKNYVRTSMKKYGLIKHNMERCVIVALRYSFTDPNDKGVFVWTYDKKRDFYVLYIIINDNLYNKDMSHEGCVKRKIVTTHEFTHCTAAMLSLSKMKSSELVTSLQKSMRKNVDVIQSVDIDSVMSEFSKELDEDSKPNKTELSFRKFDDDHFRTGYEGFEGSYYDLNTNFLFSKQLFEEFFDNKQRQTFKECIKQGKLQEAVGLIKISAETVINKKKLDRKFVLNRIKTDFLPLYLAETAKYVNTLS